MNNLRTTIRKQIRHKRKSLSARDQTNAAHHIGKQLEHFPPLLTAKHVALYLSTDGELDTRSIIEYCWQTGKNVYLPVLHPFSQGHLLFLNYTPETQMVENKYHISEPKLTLPAVIPMAQLDIIFTPLVAFDEHGQRLGMGGGYYDRSLEHWYKTGEGAVPVGLAHDCQQVELLPSEQWDIPLPYVITPHKIWRWEI